MRIIKVPVEDGVLTGYLRDTQEFEKERLRPAVVICPGGSYAECSGREGEPYALRFLTMGYQAFVLDYSVAPVRFPVALLELARAVAALADCAREIYAGAANLQELLQKLAAQLNTESLHFN